MDAIRIHTLIDITNTKVIRLNQGTQLELDQQRNFITLVQCAEIKSIIIYQARPICETLDLKHFNFGHRYRGKHRVWTFEFQTDRSGVYLDSVGNKLGFLIEDLHEVPIIKKLNETINIEKPIFDCIDSATKNIIVSII